MIPLILSVLPGALCLAFTGFTSVFTAKLQSCRMAVILQALCCVAFTSSALLFSGYTSDNQVAATLLISQLTIAELIPVALLYFRSFRKTRPQNPIWLLVFLLPFALFVAELMFVAFLGHADSVSLIKEVVHGRAVTTFASNHGRMLYDCLMWIFPALFNLLLTLSKSLGPASITGPGSSPLTES